MLLIACLVIGRLLLLPLVSLVGCLAIRLLMLEVMVLKISTVSMVALQLVALLKISNFSMVALLQLILVSLIPLVEVLHERSKCGISLLVLLKVALLVVQVDTL